MLKLRQKICFFRLLDLGGKTRRRPMTDILWIWDGHSLYFPTFFWSSFICGNLCCDILEIIIFCTPSFQLKVYFWKWSESFNLRYFWAREWGKNRGLRCRNLPFPIKNVGNFFEICLFLQQKSGTSADQVKIERRMLLGSFGYSCRDVFVYNLRSVCILSITTLQWSYLCNNIFC